MDGMPYTVQAFRPVLQALHDLALCVAAGLLPGCSAGIRLLQQQLHQDGVDGDVLAPEGTQEPLCGTGYWC